MVYIINFPIKIKGKVIGKVSKKFEMGISDDFCKKCKVQLKYISDGVYQCPKCGATYEFDEIGDAVEKWRME